MVYADSIDIPNSFERSIAFLIVITDKHSFGISLSSILWEYEWLFMVPKILLGGILKLVILFYIFGIFELLIILFLIFY